MSLKEAIDQGIIKLSSNPSGTFWSSGAPEFKSENDPSLLILKQVALTGKAGLMLIGEEVTVHLYAPNEALTNLKDKFEDMIGQKWQDLVEVEVVA